VFVLLRSDQRYSPRFQKLCTRLDELEGFQKGLLQRLITFKEVESRGFELAGEGRNMPSDPDGISIAIRGNRSAPALEL